MGRICRKGKFTVTILLQFNVLTLYFLFLTSFIRVLDGEIAACEEEERLSELWKEVLKKVLCFLFYCFLVIISLNSY